MLSTIIENYWDREVDVISCAYPAALFECVFGGGNQTNRIHLCARGPASSVAWLSSWTQASCTNGRATVPFRDFVQFTMIESYMLIHSVSYLGNHTTYLRFEYCRSLYCATLHIDETSLNQSMLDQSESAEPQRSTAGPLTMLRTQRLSFQSRI